MSQGRSPELTPSPDEDETTPMKEEQDLIPYRYQTPLETPLAFCVQKAHTLTHSVYKE